MSHAETTYPQATYRVQLHAGFPLDDLTARVPYLHALGISDVYCPPLFQATKGSKHGYDVCDYDRVSEELGGDAALSRLSAALRERGMGLLLDFVPNHMGIDADINGWWREVLEHGANSRYAGFFDISWEAATDTRGARAFVILPLLSTHYGCLLQEGKLHLTREGGTLIIECESIRLPLRPATYAELLNEVARDDLKSLATSFGQLENEQNELRGELCAREFTERKKQLDDLLSRNLAACDQVDQFIARLNGTVGDPSSFDHLDELIASQHYRLARWQAGAHGINYRRFFAINTLMGLRMEDEKVFARAHAKLAQLIREGVVTGVRIDHIDGLRDPQLYLERLRKLTEENRPSGAPPIYVVAEKILGSEESLPAVWAADGTTGYDFIPQLAGLLTASENEQLFDEIFREFTGVSHDFQSEVRTTKKLVLTELFPSTVLTLAQELHELIQVDRRWRDLTVPELGAAISAFIIGLAVYRTYRRNGEALRAEDHREITRALVVVLRTNPRIEPELLIFVSNVWLGDYPEKGADEKLREALTQWVMSLQQYTGAAMAKAVEDTAYYTFNRLIALNEVGGFPREFGRELSTFHEACASREELWPRSMLTTSTHDTKISEDVRARLYVLSEIPWEWANWLKEWRELNASHKIAVNGKQAPDSQEEYRLYQTLLGAWPIEAEEADETFKERIGDYLEKAINEAKVNTTTAHPSPDWIAACREFSDTILSEENAGAFLKSFRAAAARVAKAAVSNSFVQVVLKLTTPGVPDIYQGNEAWDFSLVDPDNRRDVNFDALEKLATDTVASPFKVLFKNWKSGGVKLALTRMLLWFRREHSELFAKGNYTPLRVSGKLQSHVVAFSREHHGERLVVVVPIRLAKLPWPPTDLVWKETFAHFGRNQGVWENVLTKGAVATSLDGRLGLDVLFADFPLGILYARSADQEDDASKRATLKSSPSV